MGAQIENLSPDLMDTAYKHSWYFIAGTGGNLLEWINGYEAEMAKDEIGKPLAWYVTTGGAINRYAGDDLREQDYFKEDLTCLLFPIDGLQTGKLAMFKLRMNDRWFDDVIQNMRRR
jgi:hypothetical protein